MAEKIKKIAAESKPKAPAKPRKPVAKKTATVTSIGISKEQIALLAHKYWAERGHQHGHDAEDWFRAEQELRGRAS